MNLRFRKFITIEFTPPTYYFQFIRENKLNLILKNFFEKTDFVKFFELKGQESEQYYTNS